MAVFKPNRPLLIYRADGTSARVLDWYLCGLTMQEIPVTWCKTRIPRVTRTKG